MIRISSPNEIYRTASSNYTNRSNSTEVNPLQQTANVASPLTDSIQISSEGSFKSVLVELTKNGGREIESAVSSERLSQIRNQITAGSYEFSTEKVADAMMSRISNYFDPLSQRETVL